MHNYTHYSDEVEMNRRKMLGGLGAAVVVAGMPNIALARSAVPPPIRDLEISFREADPSEIYRSFVRSNSDYSLNTSIRALNTGGSVGFNPSTKLNPAIGGYLTGMGMAIVGDYLGPSSSFFEANDAIGTDLIRGATYNTIERDHSLAAEKALGAIVAGSKRGKIGKAQAREEGARLWNDGAFKAQDIQSLVERVDISAANNLFASQTAWAGNILVNISDNILGQRERDWFLRNVEEKIKKKSGNQIVMREPSPRYDI
ncbi:MAG: hypothetical protein ACPG1C_07525 [Alphaproteobacteria bacterium]